MKGILTRISAAGICLGTALLVTVSFILTASAIGEFTVVDIYLGAIWTFTLSLIISSPLLIPWVRKRASR